MRTLRVVVGLLSALLLALIARLLVDGISVAGGVCTALVVALLLIGGVLAGLLNSIREREDDV